MKPFVELTGAEKSEETESGYKPKGRISINTSMILAIYSHHVMMQDGVKFRVMENYQQIMKSMEKT